MNRWVQAISLLLVFGLSGCSLLAPGEPRLTVYAHQNLAGQVRVTAVYPGGEVRAAAARLRVLDDLGRVRFEEPLDERGQARFRFPDRTVYVDVQVTTENGALSGERRVESLERLCWLKGC